MKTGAADRLPKLPNVRWAPALRNPPLGARELGLENVRFELNEVFAAGRGALYARFELNEVFAAGRGAL